MKAHRDKSLWVFGVLLYGAAGAIGYGFCVYTRSAHEPVACVPVKAVAPVATIAPIVKPDPEYDREWQKLVTQVHEVRLLAEQTLVEFQRLQDQAKARKRP